MALSFGSHACGRGGEKWVLSPIFENSADPYKPWRLPDQTHERRTHRQIRPEPSRRADRAQPPRIWEARKLYNAMIDKRPLLIARCADVADVIAAVNFGRGNKLPIAIRGGGHNGPGLGSVNDGLVIDLSTMRGVRVDPKNRTVRVGAGCPTGDVDHATQTLCRAVPFGVLSTTGVAGLTLSGGHGYLSRQYGLAVESLLEADVVLAASSFVTASETEHA